MIYNAYIYPHLTYCVEIWGSDTPQQYLDPLLKIQKKLARLITFSEWNEPAQKLFIKLGWLNIYDIHKLHIQTLAIDAGTNINTKSLFSNLVQLNNHSKLFIEKILMRPDLKPFDFLIARKVKTKKYGTTTITARISKYWNSLPHRDRTEKNTKKFKKIQKPKLLYNPTLYRKYSQIELDEIIDYIAERRMIKKQYT